MGAVVALLNQKGGVGKTTVTLGLASASAQAGRRVLVVDLDPQASATWVLGIDPATLEVSAADVLHRTPAAAAIVPSGWGLGVDVLPATPALQRREVGDPQRLGAALADVAPQYDLVLLDCPPSLGNLTRSGLTAARHALVVVEPSALSLRGIGAVADVIDDIWDTQNPHLELAGVVVNRVPPTSGEADRRLDELTRIVGRKAVWQPVVPNRAIVNQAIGERRPVHSYGSRSADVAAVFDALAAKLRRATR
jgi:cellulose biosynthesis protein BcsQ